jgi:hypothetical protein
MRKLLLFASVISMAFISKGQLWQPVGPDYRNDLGFRFSQLLWLNHDADTIYAGLFVPGTGWAKSTFVVKKFNGSVWDTVGASFSIFFGTSSNNRAITLDRFHTPYVLYPDTAAGNFGTVKKCINGVWSAVGSAGFTSALFTSSSIRIGKADQPYVLFVESGKISVWKFNSVAWDSVGNRRFATISGTPAIGFDTSGSPYVVFSDPTNLNRATVMKFNGSAWAQISPFGGLSTLGASSYDIEVDSSMNVLYFKFNDTAQGPTVKKYDGTNWFPVGAQGSLTGIGDDLSVNSTGTPYLSLRRADSALVMKFDGSNWIQVSSSIKKATGGNTYLTLLHDTIPALGHHFLPYGSKPVVSQYGASGWTKIGPYGFVPGGIPVYNNFFLPSVKRLLTTFNSNNVAHVVFSDSSYSGKLSLMKFTGGAWVYAGPPAFSASMGIPAQFEKGKNDTLYILHSETAVAGLKLVRFDGNSFLNIGSGLSNPTYPAGTSLAIDTSGAPVVIYPDPSNFNLATLKKFINGSWSVIGSLPCTTAVQMKINRKNEVHALYNSVVNGNTVSNLVRFAGGNWTTLVQSTLQGLMKIAPNDSVFLFSLQPTMVSMQAGQLPTFGYYYNRSVWQLSGTNWSSIGNFYTTSIIWSIPPIPPSESYINLVFDTNSTPYPVVVTSDSASIKAFLNGWVNLTTNSAQWHPHITASSFDLAFSSNNELLSVFAQGTAYALSYSASLVTPMISVLPSTVFCSGDTVTLSTAVITGATYTWYRNGSVIASAPFAVYKATLPGSYKVKVVYNGSIDSSSITVLTQNPQPITTVTKTNVLCNGAANGTISIAASGGTTPYTYAWNNLASTLPVVSNLNIGTYISTTTDANGCKKKDTVVITQPPALSSTKVKTNVACFGGNNGSATVTVNGGTPPYTYNWSNAATTPSIGNLIAGSYILTTTDNNNCVRTDTVTIMQPTAITNTQSHTDVSCKGGNNGTASVTPSGGVGPYTYAWNTAATTAAITSLAAGMYTVVVKDNNNCTKNDTVNIAEPASTLSTLLTAAHNTCYNDSTGKGFVTASGATPPYTYSWTNGSSVISIADSAIHLKAGSFYLTTKDANLCQKVDTVVITEPSQAIGPICAVTVDSATGKNLVIWEKTGIQNTQMYKIYRETFIANQYNLIGANASNQFSTYLDTSSIPLQQSYSYKISVVDSCNNESPLSTFHKTIHLSSNTGINGEINLNWNQYGGKPYSTHYIMRSLNAGPFTSLAQVASSSTSYSDLTPPAGQKTYRIDIDLPSLCNPTAKVTSISRISSNSVSIGVNSISDISRTSVYIVPNPTTGIVRIIGGMPTEVKITDAAGKLVLQERNTSELSLNTLASGIYLIRLYDKDGLLYHYQKIVKE